MKTKIFISAVLLIAMLTPCASIAQGVNGNSLHWVRTPFSHDAETLCVHDGFLFAGGENGLYRSSDEGNIWMSVVNGLNGNTNSPEVQLLYSYGNYLLAKVVDWGIYRSMDNGNNWKRSSIPLSPFTFVTQGRYLFAETGMIDRSPDSGSIWEEADSGITPKMAGHHAPCFGLASIGNTLITANKDGQLFRSTNGGLLWDSTSSHFHIPFQYSLSLFTINDSTLFLHLVDTLFRSTDFGMNWKIIKTGIGRPTIVAKNGLIFIGTYGVILSTDNGDSWKNISGDIIDTMSISALVIQDNYLFASGYYSQSTGLAGIWRCPLSDFTNSVVEDKLLTDDFKISPNPSNGRGSISYNLRTASNVKIELYNSIGQVLKILSNSFEQEGDRTSQFNISDLPSQEYFIRYQDSKGSNVLPILLLK
ncbi:MAG: T9SS type A sorting domain-containing protein [Bacteroidota bacterium]